MYYVFTPNYVLKLVPPLGSEPTWQTSMLYSDTGPLIYVNEIICMVIYFMAQDEPFGAKIIPKCILRGRGLVPFWVLRHSFLSLTRQWLPTPVLSPGESHGWRSLEAAVQGVAKSQTWLSDVTFAFHFHALEKAMATHSSVPAWRIPGMGEPGGLPSMGSHRVGHNWSDLAAAAAAALFG